MTENLSDEDGRSFVERIVKDPKKPPKTLLLTGFLGASSEEGHTRLYFDAQLGRYADIPDEAILHTEELPAEAAPLGGSLVWIDQDAEAFRDKGGSAASFLQGHLTQDKTFPTQPPHCPQEAQSGGAKGDSNVNQPFTAWTYYPMNCPPPTWPVCAGAAGGQAQMRPNPDNSWICTWFCNSHVSPICAQAPGAAGAHAQAVPGAAGPTAPYTWCCPQTVWPCAQAPAAAGGYAQAAPGAAGGQAVTYPPCMPTAPYFCPTIWPPCGAQAAGGQAPAAWTIPPYCTWGCGV